MGDPDRGNLFSAWFLSGLGEAAEQGASPILLSTCPCVGRRVLLLGTKSLDIFAMKNGSRY